MIPHVDTPARYEPLARRIERQRRDAIADLRRVKIQATRVRRRIKWLEEEAALRAERELLQKKLLDARSVEAATSPMRTIIGLCAEHFGVTVRDLISDRRTKPIISPRHVAMYLGRHLTTQSYPRIGRAMRRDHTTVLHGVRKIEAMIIAGDPIAEDVRRVVAEYQALRRSA